MWYVSTYIYMVTIDMCIYLHIVANKRVLQGFTFCNNREIGEKNKTYLYNVDSSV